VIFCLIMTSSIQFCAMLFVQISWTLWISWPFVTSFLLFISQTTVISAWSDIGRYVGKQLEMMSIKLRQIVPYRHWAGWCIALADIVQCRSSCTLQHSSSRDVLELHRLVQIVSTKTTHEQFVTFTNYVVNTWMLSLYTDIHSCAQMGCRTTHRLDRVVSGQKSLKFINTRLFNVC